MSFGDIIGGVLGIGGSLLQGDQQADAASDAAAAQLQAERERMQFMRDQWEYAQRAYQPYRDAGNRADGYLDALYYGSGSYGGQGAGGSGGTPDYDAYFEQHSAQLGPAWQQMVQSGQAAQFNNDPTAFARWHYENSGQAAGWELPTTGGSETPETQVGRGDVWDMIEGNPLYQMADENYTDANQEAGRAYGEERQLNANELAKMLNLSGSERQRFLTMSANEREKFLRLNTEDNARRTRYTDQAIADRERLNRIDNEDNINRVGSMLGVTGQVGKLQRAGQEEADRLNLEFADTKRGWRQDDLDLLTAGKRDAWGRSFDRNYATEGRYYDNTRDAYGNFYGNNRDAMRDKNAYRRSNLATRAGGRAAAYGDVNSFLTDRSGRGYTATGGAVTAGQNFAQGAGASARSGADAYAQGLLNQANAYGNMWNDIAGFGGEIIGGLSKSKPSGNSWNGYKSYGSDSSGGTWWG